MGQGECVGRTRPKEQKVPAVARRGRGPQAFTDGALVWHAPAPAGTAARGCRTQKNNDGSGQDAAATASTGCLRRSVTRGTGGPDYVAPRGRPGRRSAQAVGRGGGAYNEDGERYAMQTTGRSAKGQWAPAAGGTGGHA